MIVNGWCIVELFGHRKLAGYVTEAGGLYRVDIYDEDPERLAGDVIERSGCEPIATQWYGAAAIYCITATTVGVAVAFTERSKPAPVGRWELPPVSEEAYPEVAKPAEVEIEDDWDNGDDEETPF
jgi:hypothetical protein